MKTKRMSDVFELPVNSTLFHAVERNQIKLDLPDASKHAAHAINHVDALADALAVMLDVSERLAVVADFDLALRPEYEKAKSALSAYWGEK